MNAENNPYYSPHDVDRAWYDHRLFWRVVKCCGVLAVWLALMDAILFSTWMRHDDMGRRRMGPVESVQKFFTDWQSFPDQDGSDKRR